MDKKSKVTVWYDGEADFLEVIFERKPGHFRETSNDHVMAKVDKDGRVIGIHIHHARRNRKPLEVQLL